MPDDETGPQGTVRHSTLRRVLHGLALGFGFAMGMVVVLMSADAVKQRFATPSPPAETKDTRTWQKRFTSDAKLTVENSELRSTRWNLSVLGSVRNDGPDSWQFVRLEVQLFNQDGHLVRLCEGVVVGPLRPATSRYFSVECNGSEREPIPEYKKYEVKVVDASYEMENGA